MSLEHLQIIERILGYLTTIVVTMGGVYLARLRSRERMALIERGIVPDKSPSIVGPVPVLMVGFGASLLAYLLAQQPQIALLPAVDSSEVVAAAAPSSVPGCKTATDCSTGCACTAGQCTPCSAAKPKPEPVQRQKPRLVAAIGAGTLCADCLRLPQMLMAIPLPFVD